MENKLQQLNSLIEFFRTQKKLIENKVYDEELFFSLVDELKIEKKKFIDENLATLKLLIEKGIHDLKVPVLSLMQYHWNENTHSNIHQYLFDYNLFEKAGQLLSSFIMYCSDDQKEKISEKISKKTYEVYREYPVPNGRIDLFIIDEKEKLFIVIENKIFAEVGKTVNAEDNLSITQLEKYKNWCQEEYPEFMQLYILLNYNNDDENVYEYEKISYNQLYSSIKKISTWDNVFNEYKMLLKEILEPLSYDLSEAKNLANDVLNDKAHLTLNEYYILKNIFYEK